jgi:hypothetical protein
MGGGVGSRNGKRGGFIEIKEMYNNDVGHGGARVYEPHEVKHKGGARSSALLLHKFMTDP